MGTETNRTTRGKVPETFFARDIVASVRKLLEQQGSGPATQELTRLVDTNRRKFGLAIDTELSRWLRQVQASAASRKRVTEDEIHTGARDLLLREVEPLFSCALGLDQPRFCEHILKTIEGVQAFGAHAYRSDAAHSSARNPIAYLWAVLEAYKSGERVSEYLDDDVAVQENNKRQTKCAVRLLLFARQTVRPDAPGYAKVQKLRMGEQQSEVVEPQHPDSTLMEILAPVRKSVSEMPTQEIKARKIELIFQGEDELRALALLERAAKKHGGLEKFFLLLAQGLRRQGK